MLFGRKYHHRKDEEVLDESLHESHYHYARNGNICSEAIVEGMEDMRVNL